MKRQVLFIFDYMYIDSGLKTSESWSEKLLNTAKPILNSAAHAINLG